MEFTDHVQLIQMAAARMFRLKTPHSGQERKGFAQSWHAQMGKLRSGNPVVGCLQLVLVTHFGWWFSIVLISPYSNKWLVGWLIFCIGHRGYIYNHQPEDVRLSPGQYLWLPGLRSNTIQAEMLALINFAPALAAICAWTYNIRLYMHNIQGLILF